MRVVWAVSSGRYSDYGVSCLFEQKEDADAWRDLTSRGPDSYGEPYVEEFNLYEPGERPARWLEYRASVCLGDDGTLVAMGPYVEDQRVVLHAWCTQHDELSDARCARVRVETSHYGEDDLTGQARLHGFSPRVFGPPPSTSYTQVSAVGPDKEGVIKAVQDRIAEWAERTGYAGTMPPWPTDWEVLG